MLEELASNRPTSRSFHEWQGRGGTSTSSIAGRGTSPWPGSRCRGTTSRLKRDGRAASRADGAGTASGRRGADGEDQSPEQSAPASLWRCTRVARAPADDVVARVDGFQQRLKVIRGPGLDRGGHQHQRQAEHPRDRDEALPRGRDRRPERSLLDRPPQLGDPARPAGRRRRPLARAASLVRRMIRMPAPGRGSRLKWAEKGSSSSSLVVIPAPAGRTVSTRNRPLRRTAAARPASVRLPGDTASPSRRATGPGVPEPIVWPSISITGRTSYVVPTRITSSAATSSGRVTCVPANGIPSGLHQTQDEPSRHPRQDFVALRRSLETTLPDPEQRRVGRLGHETL